MDLSRRTVCAAVMAVPLLTARPAAAAGPTARQWRQLDTQLTGDVLLPGQSAYTTAKQLFSPRYDTLKPAAVVRPVSASDVAKALTFANTYNLSVHTRSGGHCYVGSSSGNGVLVLDLRRITGATLDATGQIATIGAGTLLYPIHATLSAAGRTIPTGTCPTVGIAGLTLGGGQGVDDRQYGLTADRLTAATVVLADGSIMRADATTEPDLFWALRGGGGQFGVVTQFEVQTHPTTVRGRVSLTFPPTAAEAVLAAVAQVLAAAPSSTWVRATLKRSGTGALAVEVSAVTAAGAQAGLIADLTAAAGVSPTTTASRTMSHLELVQDMGGGTTNPRRDVAHGSEMIANPSAAMNAALAAAIRVSPGTGKPVRLQVSPLDGAVGTRAVGDTAFPHRGLKVIVQSIAEVPATATGYAAARAWIEATHTRMAPFSSGRYLNYVEPGGQPAQYFGANLPRLRSVKAAYDPQGRIAGSINLGP